MIEGTLPLLAYLDTPAHPRPPLGLGNIGDAVAALNRVRARGNGGPLVSVDPATIRAEIIEERRRELFLEGHHLGDIVRYNLQLQPAPGAPYHVGGSYGPRIGETAAMPLPNNERLNQTYRTTRRRMRATRHSI